MKLSAVVTEVGLTVLAGGDYLDVEVTGGYVADLLSCVMAGAETGEVWITLQTHANIVAVASLLGISGIVVAESAPVPESTLAKAEQNEIAILSSAKPVYETVKALIAAGI